MKRLMIAGAAALLLLGAVPTMAGPFRDTEARIAEAYADYRAALFQTNQKNKAATQAALAALQTKWAALVIEWARSAPPQYADDPKLGETIQTVTKLIEVSSTLADTGDLVRSHDVLEGIRDALGDLRRRNGVVVFSDHMNAYHEMMERVLDHAYADRAALAEDVAVLAYLVKEVWLNRPQSADVAAFEPAYQAMSNSVEALRAALHKGDDGAIDAARKALKPPYSRLFLRFG
jgi:uncharacterized protein YukE